MRPQDVAECRASGHTDLRAVLTDAVASSTWSVTVLVDGELAAMFGLAPLGTLIDGRAAPWLLGTHLVPKHRRVLARLAPRYIRVMLQTHPHLLNFVHARNTVAVGWLKHMGFTLGPEQPHPVTGEPFHLFEMRDV
jgi:hypothetical protein